MKEDVKKEIAYFMQRLYRQQLTTSSGGNISFRLNNEVFITPSGLDKARIEPNQIGCISIEGKTLVSDYPLSMETQMHLSIYKARPDLSAIVHAHPPYATAFAASDDMFSERMTGEGRYVLGNISKADYRLMGTQDLADVVAEKAKTSELILMENHGLIAVGRTLLEAFDRIEVAEFTAKMNFVSRCLNNTKLLDEKQIKEIDELKS